MKSFHTAKSGVKVHDAITFSLTRSHQQTEKSEDQHNIIYLVFFYFIEIKQKQNYFRQFKHINVTKH